MPKLPHNIRQTGPGQFQVIITRNCRHYTDWFSSRQYGSEVAAIRAAQRWRDEMFDKVGPNGPKGSPRMSPMPQKWSWHRNGVSLTRYYDRRFECYCLAFKVFYVNEAGKRRSRTFYVGRDPGVSNAQIRHAGATADACRDEYEYCRAHGLPFHPERYKGWQQRTLYPFQPRLEEIQCDTAPTLSTTMSGLEAGPGPGSSSGPGPGIWPG